MDPKHDRIHFLWDPTKTPRFVVAARGLVKLYQWHPTTLSPTELNFQTEPANIVSLAWSPLSPNPFLAAATSTGSITLLSFPPTTGPDTLKPTPWTATLQPPRQSRTCTSLAFSNASNGQPHLLAQGFTKARSDSSVLVWDVTRLDFQPTNSNGNGGTFLPLDLASSTALSKPYASLVPSETIFDLCWMGSSLLAVSTQRQHIRLFDIRSPSSSGSNPQAVLQFGGGSAAGAMIGGSSGIGTGASTVASQGRLIATGITTDPFSADRIAAYDEGPPSNLALAGGSGSLRDGLKASVGAFGTTGGPVRVWDRRAPKGEIVKLDGPGGMLRGGALGVMWDTEKEGRLIVNEKGGGIGIFDLVSTKRHEPGEELAPHETLKSLVELVVEGEPKRIPPISNASTVTLAYPGLNASQKSQITVFSLDRGGEILWPRIPDRNPLLFSETATLTFGPNLTVLQPPAYPAVHSTSHPAHPHHRRRPSHSSESAGSDEGSTTPFSSSIPLPNSFKFGAFALADGEAEPVGKPKEEERGGVEGSVYRLLKGDIASVMKYRAQNGYGLEDLDRNVAVAESTTADSLAGFWRCFKTWTRFSSDARMGNYDFAYQGTQQLIEGFPENTLPLVLPAQLFDSISSANNNGNGSSAVHLRMLPPMKRRAFSPSPSRTPTPRSPQSYTPPKALEYQHAIKLLNAQQRTTALTGDVVLGVAGKTKLEQERIGALSALGWALSPDQLEHHVRNLINEGDHERAAFCALFTGSVNRSIEALQASKNQSYLTIALTLQALISDEKPRSDKHVTSLQTFRLINKVDSPYLRAIWRFGLTNDWEEVLNEDGVPVEDALALALSWVSDGLLKQYIRARAASAISSGDLTGLLFTGLRTEQGFALLQRYVNKTGDVQTAALISSFVSPSPSKRQLPRRWIETYGRYLLQWNLLPQRVAFKIRSARLARERGERVDVPPSVLIRCHFCSKNVAEVAESVNLAGGSVGRGNLARLCPSCQNALPKCSICLMVVHSSNGQREAHVADLTKDLHSFETDGAAFCQRCQHGGHQAHMFQWFFGSNHPPTYPRFKRPSSSSVDRLLPPKEGNKEGPQDEEGEEEDGFLDQGNSVCPVVGCECKCMS